MPLDRFLTYLGAIPFVVGAAAALGGVRIVEPFGSIPHIVQVYALVIAGFMAGTQWGIVQGSSKKSKQPVFLASNIMTIAVWLLFLYAPTVVYLPAMMFIFAWQYWLDYQLYKEGLIRSAYHHTRTRVTPFVILCLGLMLV